MERGGKRKGWLLGLLLLAVATLAGCGRARSDSASVVTIRFSYWGMAQESKVWEELAERFHRKQSRIRVKLEHIAGQNYHAKVLAMTVGHCAPDVLSADDEQFRQLAANGLYEDLTPYLTGDPDLASSHFYKELWDTFVIDGKLTSVPYIGNCLLLFYNRDHRRAAGLSPDPDPNWTWDDFNREAVALTRDLDGDGHTDQFALARLSWFYCLQWIWSAGGTDMDPGMTRYTLDTPEAKRGFQFYYDHLHKYHICPLTGDLPNMNTEATFLTGKVSMVLAGSWWLVQARQAKNFEWDVAPIPRGPVTRATRVTGEGLSLSPQSRHKREAWEWIKFVVSDEAQEVFARSGRGIPAVRRVARQHYASPETPEHEEYFLDAMDNYARRSSLHPNFIATDTVFNREWDRLTLGKLTVDGWLRAALPEANAIVRGEDL